MIPVKKTMVVVMLLGVSIAAHAQKKRRQDYDMKARATVLHPANVYVAADVGSQRLTLVTPGHEVVIMDRTPGWVRVFANTDKPENNNDNDRPEFAEDDQANPISGWIVDKGVVGSATANGDRLIFGAGVLAEAQAAEPHAPRDAAATAHFLYERAAEYFPDSPIAGEAAWRAADIRWQMQKADVMGLPSAKEADPNLRPRMYEDDLKKVIKRFPGTKFAALAAWDLIDSKVCGDWQGLPKCPEREADAYAKYAAQYPDSPKAAEALWNAAYRQGVLVDMYKVQDDRKRAAQAAANAQAINDELQKRYAATDWAARALTMVYKVQQQIPIYGNDRE